MAYCAIAENPSARTGRGGAALSSQKIELDKDLLSVIINRIIKDLGDIISIEKLVRNNIENNKDILKQIEKSVLAMQFNRDYLHSFLKEGTMTKKDLLAFYSADTIRDRFKLIEKEIESL